MVYGAILEKGEAYYTDLSKVFRAIGDAQLEYNWLITDCVCYPQSPETDALLSSEFCWLSGNRLTDIIRQENFQWIWGVLSGFEKDIPLDSIRQHPFPYADGYEGFWKNPLSIQHPLAAVEIVPWDSSLTLILSKRQEMIRSFQMYFPLSEDLSLYNQRLL